MKRRGLSRILTQTPNKSVFGGAYAALLGGVLFPFAFAPFHYAALAVFSLALLFFSWQQATPSRAAWRGYLFGLGQFGVGVSWVFVSMHDYGGAGIASAAALTLLLVAGLSLYPALAGYLAALLVPKGRPGVSLALFPAVWVFVEWFRGWFLTGFPWLEVGYSQLDTPLAGFAPLAGVYGLGWMTALSTALLLFAFQVRRWKRGAALGLIFIIWLGGGLLKRIEWTEPAGRAFKVTLLQGNIPQDIKWLPEVQRQTLALYGDMTRQHWDSRLIVWPETAVPAFYHQAQEWFESALVPEARRAGADLLVGAPVFDIKTEEYYNSLISLGDHFGVYRKRHLVPFGEYLPWREVLGFVLDVLAIPLSDFSAGHGQQKPLKAAGFSLSASICYEDVFGQESLMGLPEAAYLVNVSNDAWFGDSIAPHQHLQMARMRALETGRYMLRATNTGVTAVISPRGAIVKRLPQFQRAALTAEITPMKGLTPYIAYGNRPVVVGLFLILSGVGLFACLRLRAEMKRWVQNAKN